MCKKDNKAMSNELMKEKKILIAGDIMLDIYFFGEVKRISPEAPIPVFSGSKKKYVPGGAANVATNLVVAGVSADIMSIAGTDVNGEYCLSCLTDMKLVGNMFLELKKEQQHLSCVISGRITSRF